MRRHAAAVRFLLEQGARPEVVDMAGQTALHQAAMGGDVASARALLEYKCPLEARARNGDTALHFAVMVRTPRQPTNTPINPQTLEERVELVKLLVAAGADVNVATRVGHTPFDVALSFGTATIARLVQAGGVTGASSRVPAPPRNTNPSAATSPQIHPTQGTTLFAAADGRHVSGDFAAALDEYERGISMAKEDTSYPKLYRYLIQRRLQRAGAEAELSLDLAKWRPTWAKTVAQFLIGQVSETNFHAIARATSKPPQSLPCESFYFAGMKSLLDGDQERARGLFEKSIGTNETTRTAFTLARAELGRLPAPIQNPVPVR